MAATTSESIARNKFVVAKANKRRWKRVTAKERRRIMAKVRQVRTENAKARILAEAVELVKAAGYQVQAPPLEMAI